MDPDLMEAAAAPQSRQPQTSQENETSNDDDSGGFGAGWSSWFQTVAKQVQDQTVQAANRISERALQAHQEFLQEKERIMNEDDPPPIRRKLPWIRGDGSLPPYWQEMRDQILKLSKDDDTFLQPLPEDSTYEFNIEEFLGIASALLQEDPALGEKRFKLVPRKLKDVEFWRRYSYRVYQVQNTMIEANDDAEHPGWKVQVALTNEDLNRNEPDALNEAGEKIRQSAQDMWGQLTQQARQAHQTFVRDKFKEIQQEEKRQPKQYFPWFRHDGSLPPYWRELKQAILQLCNDEDTFSEAVPEGCEPKKDEIEGMAEGLLNEDSKLSEKRYDLVPRRVTDETFWQRYIYRVKKTQQKFMEENDDLDHPGWRHVADQSHEPKSPSPVDSPERKAATPQESNDSERVEQREETEQPADDSEFTNALEALHGQDNMDWDVDDSNQDNGDDDIEQQIAAELGDEEDEYEVINQEDAQYGSDLDNLEDEVAQELGTAEDE